MEMDCTEEYSKMEMEWEPNKSFQRGRPCSRKTGILVLLETACMIIFMVMTFVIYSHQERKFSMLESWMNSHTSDLTSLKSDFQITEKKVAELQNLVSNLSSYLNMSGASNPMKREMQEKRFSNIETLMTDLGSSLSSLASKQEENLQKLEHQQNVSHTEVKSLMGSLSSAASALRDKLAEDSSRSSVLSISRSQRILVDMSRSLTELKHLMWEVKSSIQSLTSKLSFTNLLSPGCTESGWILFSNSCYLFSSDTMNWTKAKDYCEEKGALLLKIEDASEREWQFVTNTAKPQEYWIGLTDQNTGQWRWVDDTPYTMKKAQWSPGQPDDWKEHGLGEEGEEGEDCGHITIYGLLNDAHCSSKMKYICEMKK